MFKQQIRSIYSFINMFLLVFQSFMPGIFAFLPTQAYAQDKQDVKSVALEFSEESNEFELSVVAESEVSYVLSYEDDQGVTKGITGVAQVTDGVARATEYAGTCSSDLKCVPDSFEKGTLELPKAEYKSDFVVVDAGLWLVSGAVATISSVDLGVEYVAPQNDGVRVQFTKLPKTSGNLRIEEIKLSDEQVKELGAYSNVAYDISSDMPDGSFEYKLQLPLPEGADENSQLVYAESVAELNSAQKIESGEIVS
ncbi:hypothetical protein KA017_00845, partial [Candidatus Woesebacteria bacterium]|nr:hypothetical protein [Candidatus Woesebacteria bacterium]